jgi:hypothetical protein
LLLLFLNHFYFTVFSLCVSVSHCIGMLEISVKEVYYNGRSFVRGQKILSFLKNWKSYPSINV